MIPLTSGAATSPRPRPAGDPELAVRAEESPLLARPVVSLPRQAERVAAEAFAQRRVLLQRSQRVPQRRLRVLDREPALRGLDLGADPRSARHEPGAARDEGLEELVRRPEPGGG